MLNQDQEKFLNHTRSLITDKIVPTLSKVFEKQFLKPSLLKVSVEPMPPSDDGMAKYLWSRSGNATYYIHVSLN